MNACMYVSVLFSVTVVHVELLQILCHPSRVFCGETAYVLSSEAERS